MKIEPQLAALVAHDPGKIYRVVIVCSSDNTFRDKKLNRLMDNIYSGELSGNEIMELMLLDEVLSIELDKTMTIE